MTLSFRSFAGALDIGTPTSVRAVYKSLYPSANPSSISLRALITGAAAPVPPLLSGPVEDQFSWSDPSAALNSPPPAVAIRRAQSWSFTLWPPSGQPFTTSLAPPGDGSYFLDDGGGSWSYNYVGSFGHGVYTWQVTAYNGYGSAESPKATFGSNGPTVSYTMNSGQTQATIYGKYFSDNICKVHVNGEGFIPDQNVTGDITHGVTVNIVCDNQGQYWEVTVTPSNGGPGVSLNVYCAGGGFG
jgi:hypothetical protein